MVGDADADAYRRFAGWAEAGAALLAQTEDGPPPSLRELAALAEAASAPRPAASSRRCSGRPPTWSARWSPTSASRPRWPTGRPLPESPADPAPGPALMLAGGHGRPAARPAGGSQATVDALVRCLEAAGGRRLRCGCR